MQGFNMGRYVPPDVEGTTSGNRLHGKRPPGKTSGAGGAPRQTVRFEMPYAVWCASCPRPTLIAQGVRFNAEKRRAGSYHTTPIWGFRFRHAECGGALEMRTDPRNTAYVVVEGGKKRDTGEDTAAADAGVGRELGGPGGMGGPGISGEKGKLFLTDQEREALRTNAFASLEKTIEDREQYRAASARIDGLLDASARHWDDPYAQNQRLRRAFRAGRHRRERDAADDEAVRERLGFGYELVPRADEDAQRARMVEFEDLDQRGEDGHGHVDGDGGGDANPGNGGGSSGRPKVLAKPLFDGATPTTTTPATSPRGRLKAEAVAARRKGHFVSEVVGNTRAAQDPFLQPARAGGRAAAARMPGVKRKRGDAASPVTGATATIMTTDKGDEAAEVAKTEATAATGTADAAETLGKGRAEEKETAEGPGAASLVDYDSD